MSVEQEGLAAVFRERFEAARGSVHEAGGMGEAIVLIGSMLKGRAGEVHLSSELGRGFRQKLREAGIVAAEEKTVADYREECSGITEAAYGIAETGSLVEVAHDESTRLASAASTLHIALLDRTKILRGLPDLAEVVRRELSVKGKRPTVTLISGPSRTSDIELKDVIGVHGPDEVHVILYGGGA